MNQITYCKIIPTIDPVASYNAAINERPSNNINSNGNRKKRSIGQHTKYWQTGKTLKILVFKHHNEQFFEAVKNGASKWLPHVNLKFDFIEMDEEEIFSSDDFLGDIRVDCQEYMFGTGGSSSIGTDSRTGDPQASSMTLGTNFTSPHYESTVIHEFGHALGLVHEHQHPDAVIPWDLEKVYAYYSTVGYSRDQVDTQVLPVDRNPGQTYAPYDRHSVMHYEIPSDLTIGNWHQPNPTQISQSDIAFVRKIYP
ncbi:peptidase M12 [Pseudomonas hormoni]|uniref:Peptidase M12 n=1 Tax=Pseudomonas hormoni TaxID=3093767 RepID=A0ABX8EYT9_9PSED|nr:M12 family metallopeptidase [Pseudomonas hormoni]QVW24480.1 peptidase M12 [Pseudomonas hormoni]